MRTRIVLVLVLVMGIAPMALASGIGGLFSTDRFGYSGTVTRYATYLDATSNSNATGTVTIVDNLPDNNYEHRDASLYVVNNAGAYGTDFNYISGSWWYHTQGTATQDGWGNINGNTGIGFIQLYDFDGSTDATVDMGFSNYSAGYWTEYNLHVIGGNATAASDYARFSVYDNVHDAGTFIDYDLNITATGLQGTQTGNVIEANNHPTGGTGTFTGLFYFGGDGDGDLYTGYYSINLVFDMDNWAWDNQNALIGANSYNSFADSQFVEIVTPIPAAAPLGLLGMALTGFVARRRKKLA